MLRPVEPQMIQNVADHYIKKNDGFRTELCTFAVQIKKDEKCHIQNNSALQCAMNLPV
jgi:hypothetical protein